LPQARRLADEAAEVDRMLDELAAPPVSVELESRILAGAPASVRMRQEMVAAPARSAAGLLSRLREGLSAGPLWVTRPVYATAAAALFGLLLGWGGVFSQSVAASEEEELVAMAFVGGGLERYDLGEWQ
jgi:hypothetical protein